MRVVTDVMRILYSTSMFQLLGASGYSFFSARRIRGDIFE
jgi:hypothetical protein